MNCGNILTFLRVVDCCAKSKLCLDMHEVDGVSLCSDDVEHTHV